LLCYFQVRALFEGGGKRVDQVGPSIPVQVCCYSLSMLIFVSLLYYVCYLFLYGGFFIDKNVAVFLFSCFHHYCQNIQDLTSL
jgi:hypothetical protein